MERALNQVINYHAGTFPEYLRTKCEEWNTDMRALDINDRMSLYNFMVTTSKEKFVRGFDFVRCKKPGGDWIVLSHLNVVDYTAKERAQEYPGSTTDRDTDTGNVAPTGTQEEVCNWYLTVKYMGSHWDGVSHIDPSFVTFA